MKKKFIVCLLAVLSLICVCVYYYSTHSNRVLKEQIWKMQNMKVNMDFKDAEIYFNGHDTVYNTNSGIKLVIFVDSLSCSSCFLTHKPQYFDISDSIANNDGQFIVVLHPQHNRCKEVRNKIRIEKFPFFCILDKDGELLRNNPDLPDNKLLRAFTLDRDNRIVLVGDPTGNHKIREIFLKYLERR